MDKSYYFELQMVQLKFVGLKVPLKPVKVQIKLSLANMSCKSAN